MHLSELLDLFGRAPLVASAQASENSPLDDLETLRRLAESSLQEGVRVLRLQGAEAIRHIRGATGAPTIGLIKRHYQDSPVYITPTMEEVESLLGSQCETIGLDATLRPRPGGAQLAELLARVKESGRLAMADCDTLESAIEAERMGFDFVGTTLAGYTEHRARTPGPDLELLRAMVRSLKIPVIAEGRYAEPWQVRAALQIGARAVVMGAALNDTPTLTKRFVAAALPFPEKIGAVDIGGTWLRFGVFDSDWTMADSERVALPVDPLARRDWILERIGSHRPRRIGLSIGGIVDPATGIVTRAKPIIPNHVGTEFSEAAFGVPTAALNDGLATAWGHACLPDHAGKRVATLALGTGVGFGLVERGRIVMGGGGEPSHLNDLLFEGDRTIEQVLGGFALGSEWTPEERTLANRAAKRAVQLVEDLFHPDTLVLCGGVGLSEWLELDLPRSPFGADAGLYGAAALALFPPPP
jgi:putative N-acetylmannosamine-6-phosphate epimerase/predicted NBD/HSP70 family sugar kinase